MRHGFLLSAILGFAVIPGGWQVAMGQPTTCPSLEESLPFDNYWVGPEFEGLHLIQVNWVCAPGEIPVGYSLEYLYQNCSPLDVGCDSPTDIMIMSVPLIAGHRENINMYGRMTNVKGVPANFSGTQLAIYFPETTVFVGAGDTSFISGSGGRDLWYQAGESLRRGPESLGDLARYGIQFPQGCRGLVRCEGQSISQPRPSPPQIALNIGGLFMAIGLFVVAPFLLLRPRHRRPLFSREPTLWRVAIGFLVGGTVMILGLLGLSLVFAFPGLGMIVGGFLVGGAALRPRGYYWRGTVLGAIAYLFIGLVVRVVLDWPESLTELVNPERLGELALMWPLLPGLMLGGYLG